MPNLPVTLHTGPDDYLWVVVTPAHSPANYIDPFFCDDDDCDLRELVDTPIDDATFSTFVSTMRLAFSANSGRVDSASFLAAIRNLDIAPNVLELHA